MPRKDGKGSSRERKKIDEAEEDLTLPFPCEGRGLIDEMNIVEIPFAVLTRSTALHRLDLTPTRYLLSDGERPIPTELGERVVIALLWMHNEHDKFQSPRICFSLRELVERTRGKKAFRANGAAMQAVKEQLYRVARTRIVTDRWWNKKLRRHTKMDASIIDYVEVIQEGSGRRPEMIEIGWGQKFFESIKDQYTKALDPQIYLQIGNPLDRRLYRWLDRHLTEAASAHRFASIQKFARSKLGLTEDAASGGRKASTRVAKKLSASIQRLNGLGFSVRLEIDKSSDDFGLTFFRLEETSSNEVVECDLAGDLLRHFAMAVHGTKSPRRRFAPQDRGLAQAWIDQYGLEASRVMASEAARLHKSRTGEKALTFRRLAIYEDAAAGAWDRRQAEKAGQQPLPIEGERSDRPSWDAYVTTMFQRSGSSEDRELAESVKAELQEQTGGTWRKMGDRTRQRMLEAEIKIRKVATLGLLEKNAYEMLDRAALEAELQNRHGLRLTELA